MAEGIELTPVSTRYYCYRCDNEISLLSPTELTCPECSTGFIEEVQDEYEDDDSDISESEMNMFNLFNVESLLRRTVVNLGEVESPAHSDHDEPAPPGDGRYRDPFNNRSFIEELEETFLRDAGIRRGSRGDFVFLDDIDAISSLLLNEADIPGHPPLPASQIKLLPIITVSEEHVEKGIQCTICMEDFAVKEKAKILPCDHFYHEACITPWLGRHGTCPNCRKLVKVTERQSKNNSQSSASRPLHRSLSSESLNSGSRRLRFAEERPSLGTIFTSSLSPFHFL